MYLYVFRNHPDLVGNSFWSSMLGCFFFTADLHYLTICKWMLLEAPATMGRIQGPLSQGEFECCWVSPSAIRLGLRNYMKLQLSIINKHQPLTHSKQGNYMLDPVCYAVVPVLVGDVFFHFFCVVHLPVGRLISWGVSNIPSLHNFAYVYTSCLFTCCK